MTNTPNSTWHLNCWYVAAHATDLDNGLFARKLLNRELILWRTEEGQVAMCSRLTSRKLHQRVSAIRAFE